MRLTLGLLAALLLAGCFEPVCDSAWWECAGPDAGAVAVDAGLRQDAGELSKADAGTTRPDAGSRVDAGSLPDAGIRPDASGAFCEGTQAKVMLGTTVSAVVSTGSVVYMDCCDAFEIVFHTGESFGEVTKMFVAAQGGPIPLGTVPIGYDPEQPVQATLTIGAAYFGSGISAAANQFDGTLTFSRDGPASSSPLRVQACLTLHSPYDSLDGARIYAPDARVLAYEWTSRFALHLLANRELTPTAASQLPLSSLPLDPQPVLDLGQIRYYRQHDNFAAFTLDGSLEGLKNRVGAVPVQGLPFVVVADGQRMYLGAFWTQISSLAPSLPFVMIERVTAQGASIEMGDVATPDPRLTPPILKVLSETAKLAP